MSDQLDIRLATLADADDVLDFIAQMGFNPRTRATWDGLNMGSAIARAAGAIVGIIPFEPRLLQIDVDRAVQTLHQTCVAVHPNYRARGVGTQLQDFLVRHRPHDAVAFTVFREDPTSLAYRWYARCGFQCAMRIASYFDDAPSIDAGATPYTLTPHDDSIRVPRRAALGQVCRDFRAWLPVHPYATRYRFHWLTSAAGRMLIGVGKLHSATDRADVLWHEGDAIALFRSAGDACEKHGWSPLRFPQNRALDELASLQLPDRWPFDLLLKAIDPAFDFDSSRWRYAGIDFA